MSEGREIRTDSKESSGRKTVDRKLLEAEKHGARVIIEGGAIFLLLQGRESAERRAGGRMQKWKGSLDWNSLEGLLLLL